MAVGSRAGLSRGEALDVKAEVLLLMCSDMWISGVWRDGSMGSWRMLL